MAASDLADDASIVLITAPPGSGKTLRQVWHIAHELKENREANNGRQVYVCNINGLINTGEFEGWIPWEDPTRWMELPSGSTLVVDEAQDFFRPTGKANLPDYLTEMERVRHYGIRLIIATQHSSFLHPHILKLVGRHEHLVRENGADSSFVYKRSSLIANVASDKALAKEDWHKWPHPKQYYTAYKSAQTHSVKKTIKSKYKRGALYLGLAVALFGVVGWSLRDIGGEDAGKEKPTASAQAVASGFDSTSKERPKFASTADYVEQHMPRIGMMPWTAKIFDGRSVTADPIVICASSLPGRGAQGEWMEASCTCFTEQGTLYDLTQPECRTLARRGPVYNPYKQQVAMEGVQGPAPAAMGAPAPAPPASSVIAGDIKTVVGSGPGVEVIPP